MAPQKLDKHKSNKLMGKRNEKKGYVVCCSQNQCVRNIFPEWLFKEGAGAASLFHIELFGLHSVMVGSTVGGKL